MNNNILSIIRVILSAVSIIVLIVGKFDIIPQSIALVIASALLVAATVWNGIEALQNGRKKAGIVNIAAATILVILCLISVLL